jgi:hypothetical protein
LLGYDKLGQTKWLINRICENYKWVWKLDKTCAIDEMTIWYKGAYCPLY